MLTNIISALLDRFDTFVVEPLHTLAIIPHAKLDGIVLVITCVDAEAMLLTFVPIAGVLAAIRP